MISIGRDKKISLALLYLYPYDNFLSLGVRQLYLAVPGLTKRASCLKTDRKGRGPEDVETK